MSSRWRTIEGIDRQIDSEQRRGKRLRRTIVEVACQTPPLVFASARRRVPRRSVLNGRLYAPPGCHRRSHPSHQQKTTAPRGVERRVHARSIRIMRVYVQSGAAQSVGGMLNEKRSNSWIAARYPYRVP
jgi:hypothetical protein